MELTLKRLVNAANQTFGYWLDEHGKPFAFSIEDPYHAEKIPGKTRIPAGRYKLAIHEAQTPKTDDYQHLYSWFKFHIEVTNVQNFGNIYIHVINTERDTEGCLGVGYDAHVSLNELSMSQSAHAFKDFYLKYYPLLKAGTEIWLTVKDVV
jgi:hypothetical protein